MVTRGLFFTKRSEAPLNCFTGICSCLWHFSLILVLLAQAVKCSVYSLLLHLNIACYCSLFYSNARNRSTIWSDNRRERRVYSTEMIMQGSFVSMENLIVWEYVSKSPCRFTPCLSNHMVHTANVARATMLAILRL